MNSFESAIIDGLRSTIKDYTLLKGIDFEHEWTKPEYLATINVAKSLTRFNSYPAEKIIIAVEENTKAFSTHCVLQEFESIFETEIEALNPSRNGKIDIAVYKTFQHKPLCTIEIKNFNPTDTTATKNALILDLKRNAEYFDFQVRYNKSIIIVRLKMA